MAPVQYRELGATLSAESSATVAARIATARERQSGRLGAALVERAMAKLGLSARAYTRVLKVARTIADLAGTEQVGAMHIAETIQYRGLDHERWA